MKIKSVRGRLWLCLPVIMASALDMTATLLGQPAEYWQSSYDAVNEFNPVAHWFLTSHPLAFVAYIIVEEAIISTLIILLPLMISKYLSVFWTLGTMTSFYSWLAGTFQFGFWISNLILVLPVIVLVYSFERVFEDQNSPGSRRSSG